ncbi:hypothetical protein [Desulfonatronum parangueonense]
MSESYRVTFVTDKDTERRLKELASLEGKSVSKFTSDFIQTFMEVDWEKHNELRQFGELMDFKPTDLINDMYKRKLDAIQSRRYYVVNN